MSTTGQSSRLSKAGKAASSSSKGPPAPVPNPPVPPITINPIKPPPWPARPDLSTETTWAAFPSKADYKRAFTLWNVVTQQIPSATSSANAPDTATERNHAWMHILGGRVYAAVIQSLLPPEGEDSGDAHALKKRDAQGNPELWTLDELFPGEGPVPEAAVAKPRNELLVDGKKIADPRWRKAALQAECQQKNLVFVPKTKVAELKEMLYDDQARIENGEARVPRWEGEAFQGKLPRADLSDWGIPRENQYVLDPQKEGGLTPLDCLTWVVLLSGYNPTYWVSRAYLFYEMGFYDLAMGDCYRALRLIETLDNLLWRNRQPGLYVRVWDAIEGQLLSIPEDHPQQAQAILKMRTGGNGANYFVSPLRKAANHLISKSLLKLHCWHDYREWDSSQMEKYKGEGEHNSPFELRFEQLRMQVRDRIKERNDENLYNLERRLGSVTGKPYPQAAADVNRRHDGFLGKINREYLAGWLANDDSSAVEVQPWGEELGVFAREDISVDDIIYSDEPSARGHLDRTRRPPLPLIADAKGMMRLPTERNEEQNFAQASRCENCRRYIDAQQFMAAKDAQPAEGPAFGCSCSDARIVAKKYFCHLNWQDEARKVGGKTKLQGVQGTRKLQGKKEVEGKEVGRKKNGNNKLEMRGGGHKNRKRAATGAVSTTRSTKRPKTTTEEEEEEEEEEAIFAPTEPSARTCLEIARKLYHYKSCGKDWDWLQKAMMPVWHLDNGGRPMIDHTGTDQGIRGGRYITHDNGLHGTVLSMILRDVFDITLLRRTEPGKQYVLAHEINEMLPLCGAEDAPKRLYPFGWAANIMVPFEILLNLGVDIFTDLTFDTWVIQAVLRKLIMNVVPWDDHCRGTHAPKWKTPQLDPPRDPPPGYQARDQPCPDMDCQFHRVRTQIENVYLHTGFAMFNHACGERRNAVLLWDDQTPNRIIVKAEKAIRSGEQVLIGYLNEMSTKTAYQKLRLFGKEGCQCVSCEEGKDKA